MKPIVIAAAGAGLLLFVSTAAFAQLSDVDIKAAVQAKGYQNPQITEHSKDHVDVTAAKNGKKVKLAVDPQTGQVSPDTDKYNDKDTDKARDRDATAGGSH